MTLILLVVSILTNNIDNKKVLNLKSPQVIRYFLLYMVMIIGIPFALHRGEAFDSIILKYLLNIIYFYFFIVYVDTIEKFERVVFVVCLSVCFYAGFGLLSRATSVDRFSISTMYDPNYLASFMITLFPLAFYFISRKISITKTIIGYLTVVLAVVVSIMTGSRGGFIGLTLVFFLIFFTPLSPLYRMKKIGLLAIFTVALVVNIDKIDTERFQTILNPEDDYNLTSEQGRLSVWETGLKITTQHPLTGVGVSCFPNAIGNYRLNSGLPPRWQAAHNSFIQILTETGVFGFLVFLSLIIGALKEFYVNANSKLSSTTQPDPLELLGKVFLAGFLGLLTTSFFLSMAYSNTYTLFFSFSVVLHNLRKEGKHTEPIKVIKQPLRSYKNAINEKI